MIEILLLPRHEVIVFPGFGDRHHHGKRQVHPVHVEEFQGVVQHRGVRSCLCDDRIDLVQILLEELGFHGLFSCQHTVHVAADRIDLSVVSDHPVGMGPHPGGRGIGRESGMHNSDRSLI